MPYIELQDPAGQMHTCESTQPEVCALWLWEMVTKYAGMNRGKPAIEIRMTALTVELPDRVAGPDWIRGYHEQFFGPLPGDTPVSLAQALIAEFQGLIDRAISEQTEDAARKAATIHAKWMRAADVDRLHNADTCPICNSERVPEARE